MGYCYYPSYYYGSHWRSYRYCQGWGFYWGYSPYCAWYLPYASGAVYYPYYTAVLGYPYYRYTYVGSGPYGEESATYDYSEGTDGAAVVNHYYYGDVYADRSGAEPEAADARRSGLPEAAPPAAARILSEAEYYLRLGDESFLSGEYASAVEAYRAAVKSEPESAVARFALAEALLATGEYHQATFEVREGLKRDEGWIESDFDRRPLYESEAEFARVGAELERHVGAHPFDANVQFLLGYARHFGGDRAGAREAFREALRLCGGDEDAQRFLAQTPESDGGHGNVGPPAPAAVPGAASAVAKDALAPAGQ